MLRGLSGSFCLEYIAAIVGVAIIAIVHAITLFLVLIITGRREGARTILRRLVRFIVVLDAFIQVSVWVAAADHGQA